MSDEEFTSDEIDLWFKIIEVQNDLSFSMFGRYPKDLSPQEKEELHQEYIKIDTDPMFIAMGESLLDFVAARNIMEFNSEDT